MNGYDSYNNYLANVARRTNPQPNSQPIAQPTNLPPFDISGEEARWNQALINSGGDYQKAVIDFKNSILNYIYTNMYENLPKIGWTPKKGMEEKSHKLFKMTRDALSYYDYLNKQKASKYSAPVYSEPFSVPAEYTLAGTMPSSAMPSNTMPANLSAINTPKTGGSFTITGPAASIINDPKYQKMIELRKFMTTPAWQSNPSQSNPTYRQIMAELRGASYLTTPPLQSNPSQQQYNIQQMIDEMRRTSY